MRPAYVIEWLNKPIEGMRICGRILAIKKPISFLGDVDSSSGLIRGINAEVRNRILVIPHAVGSTVGSYIIYGLKKSGNAPACIVVYREDPVTLIGSIISDIPLVKVKYDDHMSLFKYNDREACIIGNELIVR